MEHYVFGLTDEQHAHPECEGRAMANETIERLKKQLEQPSNKELRGASGNDDQD